ncbi:unnamed protein product [Phytophthora lilii]|uniref:peptidylprolyl isomerase n=1 Tax=Phytophthora lilii TaxID=2077276 RepID=A0A9W6X337_9STRA|nr:unnamed protein product [Phytophthora lilii]
MGVTKEILATGNGPTPTTGASVTVHCTGFGKDRDLQQKFWSTKDPGQTPFTFKVGLGQVIKGWDEGVLGMKLGETARLTCTPDYAYGAGGFPTWGYPFQLQPTTASSFMSMLLSNISSLKPRSAGFGSKHQCQRYYSLHTCKKTNVPRYPPTPPRSSSPPTPPTSPASSSPTPPRPPRSPPPSNSSISFLATVETIGEVACPDTYVAIDIARRTDTKLKQKVFIIAACGTVVGPEELRSGSFSVHVAQSDS